MPGRSLLAFLLAAAIRSGAAHAGPSSARGASAPSAQPEANLNLQDFDFVTEKIRLNYAGWETKVTDATRPELDALTARLRAEAEHATPERLTEILNEWIAFFADGHVTVRRLGNDVSASGGAPRPPRTPMLRWSEATVRAKLDALGAARDPLEGIWRIGGDRYRVGVLRMPGKDDAFSAVVLSTTSEGWKPGQVKAEVTRRADGTIDMLFRSADHAEHREKATLLHDGAVMHAGGWGHWIRELPAVPEPVFIDRVVPSDELFLRSLSDTTMWLRLPDFEEARAAPLRELLGAHEGRLASLPNLILDLRENGGGSDYVYEPISPLLYTRPVYGIGVEMRATEDNVALLEAEVGRLRETAPDVAPYFEERIARMRENLGGFAPGADRPFFVDRRDAVRAFPKRIAVLIDGAASSGEEFILEARQSSKVTLFGKENSAGVLDFANVLGMQTPSKRYRVNWASSRSLRLPDDPVDPDGIAPDIRIPDEVADPIGFVQAWLERQVD